MDARSEQAGSASTRQPSGEEATPLGFADGLRVPHTELLVDVQQVRLHGGLADEQLGSGLRLVALSAISLSTSRGGLHTWPTSRCQQRDQTRHLADPVACASELS